VVLLILQPQAQATEEDLSVRHHTLFIADLLTCSIRPGSPVRYCINDGNGIRERIGHASHEGIVQ
jgi:hypothetical protein